MSRHLFVSVIALVSVVAGARLSAHHSFTATYFEGKKATIEGEITKFQFRNPHSFVYVSVKDDKGQPQEWAIEWGGAGQLRGQNVSIDTLKPGDHVLVSGDPSRTPGDLRLRMRAITRPSDGWKWGGDFN